MFPVLFAVAAGVSIAASINNSQRAAEMQREQARIADINATISLEQSRFDAMQALKRGRQEAAFLRRESRRQTGAMVASTGSSGVELSGSPMQVIAEQIYRDEVAAGNAMTNAATRAISMESKGMSEATALRTEADMRRQTATFAEQAGWLDAVSKGVNAYAGYYSMTGGGSPNYWSGPGYGDSGSTAYGNPETSY